MHKTNDFVTFYITIAHITLKARQNEIIHHAIIHKDSDKCYKYLVED